MAMEIVYVDPGYGRLMLPDANPFEYEKNATYNTTSGVAFTAKGDYTRTFPELDLSFNPSGTAQICKKVWSVKLTAYGKSAGYFALGVVENEANGGSATHLGIDVRPNVINWRTHDGTKTTTTQQKTLNDDSFSSAGTHNLSVTFSLTATQKTGGTEYTITNILMLDNAVKSATNTTATKPDVGKYFGLYFSNNRYTYVSNVLAGVATYEGDGTNMPSDEGIPVDTMIYRLSLGESTSDSNFTKNSDGEYVANASGQNLLQPIHTNTGTQTVNHLVVYGNPGYTVGVSVPKAAGIYRPTGSSTINQAGKKRVLSSNPDAHVCDFWKINDTTLSNLYGLQVGWKAMAGD